MSLPQPRRRRQPPVHPRSRGEHKRLRWSDWLLAQRVIDEVAPELQLDGRWRFQSGPLLYLHRPVGLRLIAEGRGGVLTPITFFRHGL